MSNIKDYPEIVEIEDNDKLIGTEDSDQTVAKNFTFTKILTWIQSKLANGISALKFNGVSTPTYSEGLLFYSQGNLNFYDGIPGTSNQVNKELFVPIYNNNGSTLTNFTVVRYGGSVGGIPAAVRAQADTISNAQSFGVCTHNVIVDDPGKVTTYGELSGDTSMWNQNDTLFLSATVAGELTNIEQPILKPIARVLVADTEINGGKIYVFQQDIKNPTVIGQVIGSGATQTITSTPAPVNGYSNTPLEINTNVAQAASGEGYTANISPASPGASGHSRVCFNVSGTSTTNERFIFEAYYDGAPTGIVCEVDISNSQIDYGNDSINQITNQIVTDVDNLEIYCYSAGGTGDFTYSKVSFNTERIGNV